MFHVKPQNAHINGLVFVNSRPPFMIFPQKDLDLSLFYDKTPQHHTKLCRKSYDTFLRKSHY